MFSVHGRDLCILSINDIITRDGYLTARNQLLEDSPELIHKEIPLIAEIRKATATVTVAAGGRRGECDGRIGPFHVGPGARHRKVSGAGWHGSTVGCASGG